MLSLKDKLGQSGKTTTPRVAKPAASVPGFTELRNELGTCLMREIPLNQQWVLSPTSTTWPLLAHDERLQGFDPSQAVYLDLETNGLYLGAGAFAFLIGLGLVREGKPRLVQLFLRDPRDEKAALMEVTALLNERALVTYNGKCFDWPLLVDRFRFHRLPVPSIGAHLDMLHPARRLYRHDLSRCGLKEVEHHVLGVTREGDIDGELIPAAYNRYLREGYLDEMAAIIHHNALDISSLFDLTLYCGELYHSSSNCHREGELMAVVKSCLQGGDHEKAVLYLNEITNREGRYQAEAWYLSGMLHKKNQNWPQALRCWEKAVMQSNMATSPLIEMAKYYEHKERDYVQAHALAYQALQNALVTKKSREIKDFMYRLQRLQNKLEAYTKEENKWTRTRFQKYN